MIYRIRDNEFTVSSHGTWLPGVYEDSRTARFALRIAINDLASLWEEVKNRESNVISWGDLARINKPKKQMPREGA